MNTNEITIEQATTFSTELAEGIRKLAQLLGKNYKPLTDDDLREILNSPQSFLFIARETSSRKIVGMIMVVVYRIPYVRKAYFDDLIVDPAFRGYGIGSLLMKHACNFAHEKGAAYADFSSRPRRESSNSFYEKLGFKRRDTNVYRIIFDYGEV